MLVSRTPDTVEVIQRITARLFVDGRNHVVHEDGWKNVDLLEVAISLEPVGVQVVAHCRLSLPQKARSTNIAARPTSLTPRVRYHHGRAFSSSVSACRSAHSCAITDGVPPSFSHTDTLEFRRRLVHVLSGRRWSTQLGQKPLCDCRRR